VRESPYVNYPRAYPATNECRAFFTLAGDAITAAGLLGFWYFARMAAAAPVALLGALLAAALAAWGIYLILDARRARLVLYEDGLRLEGFLRRHAIRREEIAGWWRTGTILVTKGGERIAGGYEFATDEAFEEWMPADLERAAAVKPWIADNPELAAGSKDRGTRLAAGLVAAALVAFGATFLPSGIAALAATLLAAIPAIAIGASAWTRGAIRIGRLFPVFAVCGLALFGLAAIREPYIVNLLKLFVIGAALGVVLWLAAALADPGSRAGWDATVDFFLLLLAVALGFSVALVLNVYWDRQPTGMLQAQVMSKFIRKSAKGSVSHYLRLASQPVSAPIAGMVGFIYPVQPVRDEIVGKGLYERAQPGDRICLIFRHGAFEAKWYSVEECR
jgi:hypothetical protein